MDIASELKARIETRTRQLTSSIDYFEKTLAGYRETLANLERQAAEEVARKVEAVDKLAAAGFEVISYPGSTLVDVYTNVKKLTDVYKAVGRLDPKSLEKEVGDHKKKTVKLSIRPAAYPQVVIHYDWKLSKTDKCRIVTERVTERRLVCEV